MIAEASGCVWVCNGSQVFPQMIFKESVSKEHPEQLKQLTEAIAENKKPVAFLSGDVHFSEISKLEPQWLGYESYELTSSSIHSSTLPGVPDIIPNKRRVVATGRRNYLLVSAVGTEKGIRMKVSSHSARGRLNFEKNLEVEV